VCHFREHIRIQVPHSVTPTEDIGFRSLEVSGTGTFKNPDRGLQLYIMDVYANML